jgi:hypothetical protein
LKIGVRYGIFQEEIVMVDFKVFANIGFLSLIILGFLMICGLPEGGPAFISILGMVLLALYFAGKNG